MPRDIDPAVNDIDNAYLYDIDGLQDVVDANRGERRRAAEQAHLLIDEEVRGFIRWRQSQAITPMIVGLRESLLDVGEREVERFRRKLGTLAPDQQDTVRQLTRAVIQKILHRPIRHLRSAVDRGDIVECLDLYRELFGVDPDAVRVEPLPTETDEPLATDDDALGPQRLLRGGKED